MFFHFSVWSSPFFLSSIMYSQKNHVWKVHVWFLILFTLSFPPTHRLQTQTQPTRNTNPNTPTQHQTRHHTPHSTHPLLCFQSFVDYFCEERGGGWRRESTPTLLSVFLSTLFTRRVSSHLFVSVSFLTSGPVRELQTSHVNSNRSV